MISFRFHLVSLVAVFMALGLGILAGTTVLNRGIVAQLERQTRDLVEQRDQDQAEIAELRQFAESTLPHVLSGRLSGQDAVLVTQEGTDDAAINRVREGLEAAGADVMALLSVGTRMALTEESDRVDLANAVGAEEGTDPADLKLLTAEAVADRLSFGPDEEDLLEQLIQAEFLLNQGPGLGEQGLSELSTADVVVVVGGGSEQPALRPDRFLVPLVASLAGNGGEQAVAAAESFESAYEFVTLLRSDGDTANQIVTQDNVDELLGEVGLVLALEDPMVFGEAGHFGAKDGASDLIPPAETG
ncbi:MAG TPA: copper transporter [Propionibacteriaceae bacterium]|nr:copper transporter [Propionibacteriaceae bacterium]